MKNKASFLLIVLILFILACKAFSAVTEKDIPTTTTLTTKTSVEGVSTRIPKATHLRPKKNTPIVTQQASIVPNDTGIWRSIGPDGGEILTMAIDPATPTTLYAGINIKGVIKSTNGGGDWKTMNNGLTELTVSALAIDPQTPNTLYAGTFSHNVFRSVDGGENWVAANTGLIDSHVAALVIDPLAPSTIYAGAWSEGIIKSTDGGWSWSAVNDGLADKKVRFLLIDPGSPNILYAGQNMAVCSRQRTAAGIGWQLTPA